MSVARNGDTPRECRRNGSSARHKGAQSRPQPAQPGARRARLDGVTGRATTPWLEPKETTVALRSLPGQGREAELARLTAETVPVCGPANRLAVLLLGRKPAEFEHHARTTLRAQAVEWTRGLRTPSGKSRSTRIAHCGHIRPAIGVKTGEVGMVQVQCRDRACPSCGRIRARKLGHELRAAVDHRVEESPDSRLLFVTLTVPKVAASERGALDSIDHTMRAWSKLTKANTRRGREWSRHFAGGVRTMEVTWSERGDVHGDHVVAYSGWHAHLHCLVELAKDADHDDAVRWLVREWCGLTGASPSGQKVMPMDKARVGQLTKYVSKPLEDAARRPERARELFRALHARRLMQGFGGWKGWRSWVEDDADDVTEPLLISYSEIGELEKASRTKDGRPSLTEVYFKGFVGRESIERKVLAAEVWAALEKDPRTFAERWQAPRAGATGAAAVTPAPSVPERGPPVKH